MDGSSGQRNPDFPKQRELRRSGVGIVGGVEEPLIVVGGETELVDLSVVVEIDPEGDVQPADLIHELDDGVVRLPPQEKSGLTVYDLAAMRYGLASLVAVPLCLYYKPWRGLSLTQIAVISFILGPVYIISVFSGFLYAPAAHGGIFMNGVLPLISIGFGVILFRTAPGFRQVLGMTCGAVHKNTACDS